jgi:P-type Ca2+ transporter type 2C
MTAPQNDRPSSPVPAAISPLPGGLGTSRATPPVEAAHARDAAEVLTALRAAPTGLDGAEAAARLGRFGPNALPKARPPGLLTIFGHQFKSPLIYILLLAAGVSVALGDLSDAGFIAFVLLVNAAIGTVQERSAQKSADALSALVSAKANVLRDGDEQEIDAAELVPGDIVLLESGNKVPADVRLLSAVGLSLDESLLTGESLAVTKDPKASVPQDALVGDQRTMAFAATMVAQGRGRGVVVATGALTQVGRIATSALGAQAVRPPLLERMDRFTRWVGVGVGLAVLLLGGLSWLQGASPRDVFMLAVALAVAAIPEGLPVALTVALSIGVRRMSRKNVIVRRLAAVEALGSCTYIASDKTGTLTMNELTVRRLLLPAEAPWSVSGEGTSPEGLIEVPVTADQASPHARHARHPRIVRLCQAAALCNDGTLARAAGGWIGHGDAVDVALLVLARKLGLSRPELEIAQPRLAAIPFEAEHQYAATVNGDINGADGDRKVAYVKGSGERVLPMCAFMAGPAGDVPIDRPALEKAAEELARQGYRVLAIAAGPAAKWQPEATLTQEQLTELTFLGFVGMIDPLRPEAAAAVAACRRAGIEVAMVTGDHPITALAIARELGMAEGPQDVVTGAELRVARAAGPEALSSLARRAHVFARVEPQQKLEVVQALMQVGHFVAVTGDGANDAPALRAAHIGVAMGRSGTDVARESAELLLADDNFSSIVAGVEEGRIAYGNVRKVIFMLVSTGAAVLSLFVLTVATGLPAPFVPVQLLWLNLVTNGIQDVALAFEPGEGGELDRPPRSPREPVFDRLMIERTILSALVMAGITYAAFRWMLEAGWTVPAARNGALLLMVFFQNVQTGNSRSETRSLFKMNPLRNPMLLVGTVGAQLLHIAAMYAPGLQDVLNLQPVTLEQWIVLACLALSLFFTMEIYKLVRQRLRRGDDGSRPGLAKPARE